MMKALLLISICVLGIAMIVPTLLRLSVKEETETLRYTTLTFNFEDATTDKYSSFVNSLRNEVKSKEVFDIPVTAETATDSKRFVLVELKIDSQKSITLGIDVIDLYVVGYRDRYKDKDRASFLSDAPAVARKYLFQGATVREIGFKGTYTDLEKKAGGRENIELGVNKLDAAANSVYGKSSVDSKTEAKFFIISIQMVSEAARFKYILTKVLSDGDIWGSYKPDPKALTFETSWDKISKAIQTANANANGTFSTPIDLKHADGKPWKVMKVEDIAEDMGILKFYKA